MLLLKMLNGEREGPGFTYSTSTVKEDLMPFRMWDFYWLGLFFDGAESKHLFFLYPSVGGEFKTGENTTDERCIL